MDTNLLKKEESKMQSAELILTSYKRINPDRLITTP